MYLVIHHDSDEGPPKLLYSFHSLELATQLHGLISDRHAKGQYQFNSAAEALLKLWGPPEGSSHSTPHTLTEYYNSLNQAPDEDARKKLEMRLAMGRWGSDWTPREFAMEAIAFLKQYPGYGFQFKEVWNAGEWSFTS